MDWGAFALLDWLALAEHELLLFAGCFFLIGALDELAVDAIWGWLKLTGRARTGEVDRAAERGRPLSGRAAVLIPAWREAEVIGATISHALSAWPQEEMTLYVGCYRNDGATAEAVMAAARGDHRLRLVMHDRDGPTTKADCLNRLYRALGDDERRRGGEPYRMVLLHDAEDMVDPAALSVLDRALDRADFVQIPVRPEPQAASRWVAGHYCEEFAETHGALSQLRIGVAGQAVRRVRERTSSMWRTTSMLTPRFASLGVTMMRAISLRRRGPARARVVSSASSISSCAIAC